MAVRMGMAKPIPLLPPLWLRISAFTPMTSPLMLARAPPELPGLMAASVWIMLTATSASFSRGRSTALTTPEVTVPLSPNGLPMATATEPTAGSALASFAAISRFDPGSTRTTATSEDGSAPTTFPLRVWPSDRVTCTVVAVPTTCELVTISPEAS